MNTKRVIWATLIGAAIMLPAVLFIASEERSPAPPDYSQTMAETICRMAIEQRAHDPTSIEWLRLERTFAYSKPDKTAGVSIQHARATNAMGGKVRTRFVCEVARGKRGWEVTKLAEK